MPGKRFKAKEIVNKLRQADIELAHGSTAAVCKLPVITDATSFRRRKERGGMKADQAKRLKAPQQENERLKRLLARLRQPPAGKGIAARGALPKSSSSAARPIRSEGWHIRRKPRATERSVPADPAPWRPQ